MGTPFLQPAKLAAAPSNSWARWASARPYVKISARTAAAVKSYEDAGLVCVFESTTRGRTGREIVRVHGDHPPVEVIVALCKTWTSVVGQEVDGYTIEQLTFTVTSTDGAFYVTAGARTATRHVSSSSSQRPNICLSSLEADDVDRSIRFVVASVMHELAVSDETKARYFERMENLLGHVVS